MRWHFEELGTHVHVLVFMNGALCGRLCFTDVEFAHIRMDLRDKIEFVEVPKDKPR